MEVENDSLQRQRPLLQNSKSSPFATSTQSVHPQRQSKKENILQSLPLNLLLTTSQNTTISLQLTELINHNNNSNNNENQIQNNKEQLKNTKDYKIGDVILFNKSKQGLIRYIGPLHNDSNQWYGIEVIGGSKGFHDGTFQGHKYFAVNTPLYPKTFSFFFL